ncbi:MAG: hypothetical protein ABI199_03725 [Bacteroidia bacterium]
MKMRICVILFSIYFIGCKTNNSKTNNLNCPEFYPEIEHVYWAEQGFTIPSDTLHDYWYRLITFSEEEGFCTIIEELRQGKVEGAGKMQVVKQINITHVKGIENENGISLDYDVKKWISPKEVVLILEEQPKTTNNYSCKIVNLDNLSVKDTTLK